ncbi:substrate-binding domain-containing protein [uncultured Draconibacterium sp.]|uniref:substrate-binding domain-containing protein n=1 Tax=uncultured Draconibacterium sp. TaxID=1573823 RepID=UPI0025D7C69C|nr:substrate-binding domain-containing protein [uncultured Draconibacterium sp.]
MQKRNQNVIPVLFLLFVFLPNWAFTQSKNTTEKPLKLVFITTCVHEDFFKPLKKGMAEAAELMNVECSFTGTEDVDAEAQAAMVTHAVKNGVDGIALNIIDPIAFDKVVEDAIAAGVPVVAFNVDDNKTPNARLSRVCQNLFVAGEELGKKVADKIPENSTVILTMHSEGISALEDRRDGIKKALQHKNIKWIEPITGIFGEESALVIADALKENPDAKAILCTGLADTEGAGIAIEKEDETKNLVAAGFDLSPTVLHHIKKGHLAFTIDQQPYMQGFLPVVQLTHYIRFGIVPSNNEIGASFVDKNNVDKVEKLIHEGYR